MNKGLKAVFAYIDTANLDKGTERLGWDLDYPRFRKWLSDKYSVEKAYMFIGDIAKNAEVYAYLQKIGFEIVLKEVSRKASDSIKGNCDAELVLQAVCDAYESRLDKAVLVSSDGDYACLVRFLKERGAFKAVVSPDNKCSFLLRKMDVPILYLDTQRNNLEMQG